MRLYISIVPSVILLRIGRRLIGVVIGVSLSFVGIALGVRVFVIIALLPVIISGILLAARKMVFAQCFVVVIMFLGGQI